MFVNSNARYQVICKDNIFSIISQDRIYVHTMYAIDFLSCEVKRLFLM